ADVCSSDLVLICVLLGHITGHWEPEFLLFAWEFKYLFSASNTNKVINVIKWSFLDFLIFCFSLLKYTYYYNYRSHISLQVAKLAKSAGVQILIFPTVYVILCDYDAPLVFSA